MPYRFQEGEDVQTAVRRCAREQLDRAIEELTEGVNADPVEAVHAARKALKKERSLLRLTRGSMDRGQRRQENAALRLAGQRLSLARDAEITIQALDDLADRYAGQLPKSTFDAIRDRLDAQAQTERDRLMDSGLTAEVADELRSIRTRSGDWTLGRRGWAALEPGLLRVYRDGRAAFKRARRGPTTENLHEWRKRAKDLWYHLRLLANAAPGTMRGHADDAHRLSDLLGDDHDLAVLRDRLPGLAPDLPVDVDPVYAIIDLRRADLQAQAMPLGERLYAEKPKAFGRRLRRYWKAWRTEGRSVQARRPRELASVSR